MYGILYTEIRHEQYQMFKPLNTLKGCVTNVVPEEHHRIPRNRNIHFNKGCASNGYDVLLNGLRSITINLKKGRVSNGSYGTINEILISRKGRVSNG